MKDYYCHIKAEFIKVRHSWILFLHFIIPIIGLIAFLSYYRFSSWSSFTKLEGYIQVLTIAFPFLTGIIAAMAIEQEWTTGHYFNCLIGKKKYMNLLSKISMLMLLGLGALIIALLGFYLGFTVILKQSTEGFSTYIQLIGILFISQIFGYFLHIIVSFRYGSGASIGLGIVESLITALFLTSLGDRLWRWVPCSWGARLCDNYILEVEKKLYHAVYIREFREGLFLCVVTTMFFAVIGVLWYNRFEGRKGE